MLIKVTSRNSGNPIVINDLSISLITRDKNMQDEIIGCSIVYKTVASNGYNSKMTLEVKEDLETVFAMARFKT